MMSSMTHRYICGRENDKKERCQGVLRALHIAHNDSALIDKSYLRYCDVCHTVYLLVPKKIGLERYEIPFLEYMGLAQMEALNV